MHDTSEFWFFMHNDKTHTCMVTEISQNTPPPKKYTTYLKHIYGCIFGEHKYYRNEKSELGGGGGILLKKMVNLIFGTNNNVIP